MAINRNNLTKIERIIYDNFTDYLLLAGGRATKDEAVLDIFKNIKAGNAIAVEDDGLVCLFTQDLNYIARFDIFSDNHSFKMITSGQKITKFLFEETGIRFVYGYSTNKKMVRAIERGGWKYMGTMPESYWDGEKFIDQYMFGVSKKEFFEFLEKKKS